MVRLASGLSFQLRNMRLPEFVKISDQLKEEYDLDEGGVFSMAVDQKNPDLMGAYAKLVLPTIVTSPRIIPEQEFDEDDNPITDPEALGVNELAPMDLFRLNSASIMGKSEILEMMTSFRTGKPNGEDDSGDSGSDTSEA